MKKPSKKSSIKIVVQLGEIWLADKNNNHLFGSFLLTENGWKARFKDKLYISTEVPERTEEGWLLNGEWELHEVVE